MRGWTSLLARLGGVFSVSALLMVLLWTVQPSLPLEWIAANGALGVGLLAVALVGSQGRLRERLRSGAARRVGKYGTSAVVSALASIAILGLLGFLSTRYSVRFDWTEQRVHTLAPQTLELLEGLDRDLEITALMNPLDATAARDLGERYAYASDRVRIRFIDPNERPDVVAGMELDEADLHRGLWRIQSGEGSIDLRDFSEVAVTQALIRLLRQNEKAVYFLEGHNERPIRGPAAQGPKGFARAAASVENETYRVATLLLAAAGDVPEDAGALVIAGPTRIFLPEERAALHRYVERGGALMVMIDPRARTDLHADLREWGIRMGEDVVVDPQLALFGRATSPFAGRYAAHPITEALREPTLFHMARSVDLASADVTGLETIIYSGSEAWAERDLDGWAATGRAEFGPDDVSGPVPLAVAGIAAASAGTPGRIVVIGDSDFATNAAIDSTRNRDLFVNSIHWLAGEDDAITVRPHQSRASRFPSSTERFARVQFLALFALPQTIALAGVLVGWMRRRAEG
jgi:ABC-type uncharacterized transport system involved in gliding motility auxiliary subunit